MPSVVGLLEQRELTARRRVDDLREEADRLQAELAVAEREWNEWVIARSRVGEVLAPGNDAVVGPAASEGLPLPVCSRRGPNRRRRRSGKQWCRCGARGWPGRRCRWTTSASCRPSATVTDSVKEL